MQMSGRTGLRLLVGQGPVREAMAVEHEAPSVHGDHVRHRLLEPSVMRDVIGRQQCFSFRSGETAAKGMQLGRHGVDNAVPPLRHWLFRIEDEPLHIDHQAADRRLDNLRRWQAIREHRQRVVIGHPIDLRRQQAIWKQKLVPHLARHFRRIMRHVEHHPRGQGHRTPPLALSVPGTATNSARMHGASTGGLRIVDAVCETGCWLMHASLEGPTQRGTTCRRSLRSPS